MARDAGAIGAISKAERPEVFVQRFEELLARRSTGPRPR